MKKILITYAVKDELIPINFPGYEVCFVRTGVGKTNAAMKLTKAIYENKPDFVVNIGTAGTLVHEVGEIVVCSRFIDRDFQAVCLPGIIYEIDFTGKFINDEVIGKLLGRSQKTGTCNTGDSFVTELGALEGDVVDMEGFAEAAVCNEFGLPFISIKYITDKIGENSVQHWVDKLADARQGLTEWFKR